MPEILVAENLTETARGATEVRRVPPPELSTAASQVTVGAMGWLREYPDFRDYGADNEKVMPLLARMGIAREVDLPPTAVDLRAYCSPIEDQGALGSCTANAGAGIYEYFERRAFGHYVDVSRLFLYKATRNLLRWTGDTGAYLRTTMGAMTLFGVPPEDFWPYDVARFEVEPTSFCYAFAQNFQALSYHRLDPVGTAPAMLLARIRRSLAAKLPAMFGFTVYDSIRQAAQTGEIPFPSRGERILGGHAIVAVGFDDAKRITNATPGSAPTNGAFLIRNSWGAGWGARGYGWLPYEFVLRGLAVDWWVMLKAEWVETGAFGLETHH